YFLNGAAGVSYTFVRFVTDDGQVLSKKNVAVDNELNSYLRIGAKGRYCFYPARQTWVLCGYRDAGRMHVGQPADDPITYLIKSLQLHLIAWGLASLLCVGIPFLIFTIVRLSVLKAARPSNEE